MLGLGALTFIGCALIITVMVVAMLTIKKQSGFWERDGGYEYNLAVIRYGHGHWHYGAWPSIFGRSHGPRAHQAGTLLFGVVHLSWHWGGGTLR